MTSRSYFEGLPLPLNSPQPLDPLARPLFAPQGQSATPQDDVPPALSPLDAFAMQGRLLQKRFEEQNIAGRRMSRLPHMTVATEFAKARPGYFRSMTTGSHGLATTSKFEEHDASFASTATQVKSGPRPKSHYPQMGHSDAFATAPFPRSLPYLSQLQQVNETSPDAFEVSDHSDYWSLPRSESPEELEPAQTAAQPSHVTPISPPASVAETSWFSTSPPSFTIGPSLLAPPGPPRILDRPSPSIRPVPPDPSEDLSNLFIDASTGASAFDKPKPVFQNTTSFSRSPSLASDKSFSSNPPVKPSFNYSRPLSSQGRPSLDYRPPGDSPLRPLPGSAMGARLLLDHPDRQDSTETPLTPFTNDAPQTPISLASDELFVSSDPQADSTPTSFVYKKYALGPKANGEKKRESRRESMGIEAFINSQFNWDDATTDAQLTFSFSQPFLLSSNPPSPLLNSTSTPKSKKEDGWTEGGAVDGRSPRQSGDRQRRRLQKLRPSTSHSTTDPRDQAIEDHLERGIELHQEGALQESTYHFRLAAKAGHPTAMLLYALACRHGWGMKQNAAEGVLWLQHAVNSAQHEVAEDVDTLKSGNQVDSSRRRTHMAQFALSVYELGMSHMNGWGVAQDKALGLRCFEIAGNWGDADALSQAALCYAEGIGCRRDMKKAAKLYRMAEAKGVTVAGNSW